MERNSVGEGREKEGEEQQIESVDVLALAYNRLEHKGFWCWVLVRCFHNSRVAFRQQVMIKRREKYLALCNVRRQWVMGSHSRLEQIRIKRISMNRMSWLGTREEGIFSRSKGVIRSFPEILAQKYRAAQVMSLFHNFHFFKRFRAA